jgi:hypothetical protein
MKWSEIAISPVWRDFWDSPEVRAILEGTERQLRNGKYPDVASYQRLQARLNTLEEIRRLPIVLAQKEREAERQMGLNSLAGDAAARLARVLSLPRVD